METETIQKNGLSLKNQKSSKHLLRILILAMFFCLPFIGYSQEISLFDADGDPIAYIADDDDMTIYMWSGTPVAYLVSDRGDAFHIYGFNGKHLGWLEKGIVRDHEGYAVGFVKGATNIYTKYEPYKSYKQYKPYKAYKEYAPYKPYYKSQFSNTYLSLFLKRGAK